MIHPSFQHLQEQRAKNKWYPLPSDYGDLTKSGQHQARMSALCKQDTSFQFVAAWDLFRKLYLLTTPKGFFYHDYYPSPSFHYEIIHDCGAYAMNLIAAPRGFAKSVIIGTELPMFLLLTRPYYRIVLSMATDKMIESRFDTVMKQFTENEFMAADFGGLKPKRGDAIWNRHHIQLVNGSLMQGFSVTGRKRGARPDLFLLDDPEYDPESDSEEASQILKEKFETFLFRQTLPMLEKNSGIFWIGTMIGKRSFLYHACFSEDERFKLWNRKVFSSATGNLLGDLSKVSVLWDGKWDVKTLKAKRVGMGHSAFMAELQNDPTSTEERVLKIDRSKNEYLIEDYESSEFQESPLTSEALVRYDAFDPALRKWKPTTRIAKDLFRQMFRIVTFDPARGLGLHNDYSCITVSGFDRENCLWILDMWMGRAKEVALLNMIYKMGMLWQPRVLGIESVGMQIQITDSMNVLLAERKYGGWQPRVMPVDYKKKISERHRRTKADRIATLEWRFEAGKIKYPLHRSEKWPFRELYAQTRDFTYDMALLRFDDAIDTVAMNHYVIHGKGARDFPSTREPTIADQIRAGQLTSEGVPIISGINANELDGESLQALINRSYKGGHDGQGQGHGSRSRHPYVVRRPRREHLVVAQQM